MGYYLNSFQRYSKVGAGPLKESDSDIFNSYVDVADNHSSPFQPDASRTMRRPN